MRYSALTMKSLGAAALVTMMFTMSCKTKKATVQTPVKQTEQDTELNNMKRDLPGNQVERTSEGIKFTFDSEILFPTNSSYLNANSSKSIADVVRVINGQGNTRKIIVEGHSDKTGTAEYNLWLSDKRATSVKNYLVSLGVAADRITTAGLGDTRPIAENSTKEGRMKNRRVEITLLKDAAQQQNWR